MELSCHFQNYHWGKKGLESAVARLSKGNKQIIVSDDMPYAELWMGTHPSGPSLLKNGGRDLGEYLAEFPDKLGRSISTGQLPFLFKVLSVRQPLSVQAHPTKEHAEKLHAEFPGVYKDSNHKPELAVALTDFEALCGFRPQKEIQFFLANIPEFKLLIQEQNISEYISNPSTECLKRCFQDLMVSSNQKVKLALDKLAQRLTSLPEAERADFKADLVAKLIKEFPGDVGCLCAYWLNHVILTPGQALYLGPNEPHAYLSGDCVECMANSDNVVRAGLTPKFRDVTTLCSMLTYQHHTTEDILFQSAVVDNNTQVWSPPVPDFAVSMTKVSPDESYQLPTKVVASILLVVEGQGFLNKQKVAMGSVLFLSANEVCLLKAEEKMTVFQAFCSL